MMRTLAVSGFMHDWEWSCRTGISKLATKASKDIFIVRAAQYSSLYCNPYTTTRFEKVGRYTCPLAIVGAANFA